LEEELRASVKLIKLGLGEFQNIDHTNDFYFLPFQLLSQGFERLMKSHICLGYLDKNKRYPEFTYLKNLGHDLEKLLMEILIEYYNDKSIPVLREDKSFLTQNNDMHELLHILSEFGKFARYYNFDIISSSNKISINPKDEWAAFETKIMNRNPEIINKFGNWEVHNEIYGEISRHIIVMLERLVSALSRQFTFNTLGEKGTQLSTIVFDFAMLYEKDFGNTDYRKHTTRYKEAPRMKNKRTFIDEIKRRFNSNFKWKLIKKSDYVGEWPFYVDEVIVECRHSHWCIVTIEGYDYALNGSAKGRYKLENAIDGGMAIPGKPLGDFIDIARNL